MKCLRLSNFQASDRVAKNYLNIRQPDTHTYFPLDIQNETLSIVQYKKNFFIKASELDGVYETLHSKNDQIIRYVLDIEASKAEL